MKIKYISVSIAMILSFTMLTSSLAQSERPIKYFPSNVFEAMTGRSGKIGKGGGKRGECDLEHVNKIDENIDLQALVPRNQRDGGLSNSENPDFWVYVPYTLNDSSYSGLNAEFIIKEIKSTEEQSIYTQKIEKLNKLPGIISIKSNKSLKPNTLYSWSLTLKCPKTSAAKRPSSGGMIVYLPNSTLGLQASQLSEIDKADLYAKNGYWYDGLSSLGYRKNQRSWKELLESAGIGDLKEK
jgi:Domain of Unknown Function (DUF928)